MRSLGINPKHELWTIMKEFGIEAAFEYRELMRPTTIHLLPCLITGEHGVKPRLAPRLQSLVALETFTRRPSWHELLAKTLANGECIESKRLNTDEAVALALSEFDECWQRRSAPIRLDRKVQTKIGLIGNGQAAFRSCNKD